MNNAMYDAQGDSLISWISQLIASYGSNQLQLIAKFRRRRKVRLLRAGKLQSLESDTKHQYGRIQSFWAAKINWDVSGAFEIISVPSGINAPSEDALEG